MTKTAVVITSTQDIALCYEYMSSDHICLDYSTLQIYPKKKLKYFFVDNKFSNENEHLPQDIALNWYRHEDKSDLSFGPFSMGMILEKRLSFMLIIGLKFYLSLSHWISKYDKIIMPKNLHPLFDPIVKKFSDKIIYIEGDFTLSKTFTTMISSRAKSSPIKIRAKSSIARLLQNILSDCKENRTLIFPDWTYANYTNSKYLYLNSKSLSSGFYLSFNNSFKEKIEAYIALHPVFSDYIDSRVHSVVQSDVNQDQLKSIIVAIIEQEYKDARSDAIHNYVVFKELVDKYKPKSIIIPDDGYNPWYNMLLQVTSEMNIPTYSIQDGYLSYIYKDYFKLNRKGDGYLVDNYMTMGTLGDMLVNKHVPKLNTIMIEPPLISNYLNIKKNSGKNKYEFIILIPSPAFKLSSFFDMRYKYVVDVIKCLRSIGFNKIAVKIKRGFPTQNDKEILQNILISNDISNVELLTGDLFNYISISKYIIGQLSTSIIESMICNTPYFVYEPLENGLNENDFTKSIVNGNNYARDINQLKTNIVNESYLDLPLDKLINGKPFTELIN